MHNTIAMQKGANDQANVYVSIGTTRERMCPCCDKKISSVKEWTNVKDDTWKKHAIPRLLWLFLDLIPIWYVRVWKGKKAADCTPLHTTCLTPQNLSLEKLQLISRMIWNSECLLRWRHSHVALTSCDFSQEIRHYEKVRKSIGENLCDEKLWVRRKERERESELCI